MQSTVAEPAVVFGPYVLTVADVLQDLHFRGQLLPLLNQAALTHCLV